MYNKMHIKIILLFIVLLILLGGITLPIASYMLAAHSTILNFAGIGFLVLSIYLSVVYARHLIKKWINHA